VVVKDKSIFCGRLLVACVCVCACTYKGRCVQRQRWDGSLTDHSSIILSSRRGRRFVDILRLGCSLLACLRRRRRLGRRDEVHLFRYPI
jgi:hypothetical protein